MTHTKKRILAMLLAVVLCFSALPFSVSADEITLDASTLAGTTIVVFETLYSDGVEIAAHTDINDEAQTVEITEPEKPTLGTTATVDGQHTADPTGEITIVDVVEYTSRAYAGELLRGPAL